MNGGRKSRYRPPRYWTPADEARAQRRLDRAFAFGQGFIAGVLVAALAAWLA